VTLDSLTASARRHPDQPALVFEDRITTYGELELEANRVGSALLALGLKPGDRVVSCGVNSPGMWTVVHALRKTLMVSVPGSYRLTPYELHHILATSQAVCVFTDPERLPIIVEASRDVPSMRYVVVIPDGSIADPGPLTALTYPELLAMGTPDAPDVGSENSIGPVLMFTSGTTGPKGALRRALPSSVSTAIQTSLGFRPDAEVHLCVGPLYHSGPMRFASIVQAVGGTVVLSAKFEAEEWLRQIDRWGVTSTFVVATMMKRALRLPDSAFQRADLSTLRLIILGAGPSPASLKADAANRFGPIVVDMYGSTETGSNTLLPAEDLLRKPGSCGKALPGNELRIMGEDGAWLPPGEVGELYVRSPMVVDRYLGDAVLQQVDDFTTVGDLGYLDDEGFLFLVDRKSDMIITGGLNVYPAEVEAVLQTHPAVADVAVFGIPSEEFVESVHAVVQPVAQTIDLADLEAYARTRLAGFKVPRSWEIRQELPRNDAGKMRKGELRQPFWNADPGRTAASS